MKPHDLKPAPGAHQRRSRAGRGEGSGRGKTAGRGTKGTKARGRVKAFFEGGQMPLVRRVPKLKGFKRPHGSEYAPVNLVDLASLESAEVGPEDLRAAGLVSKRARYVKILGDADVARPLTIRAHAFSASARQKIEAAGGSVELLGTRGAGRGG